MPRLLSRAVPVLVSLMLPIAAQAQLFRAYVASYGLDTNPCTVAAPCRLLPAALNAVADKGEIWILDSANYNSGTVSITKSVSILAVPGQIASIVAVSNGAAINIATANVRVALRNVVVTSNATNPGSDGITVTNGALLSIEDCLLANLPNAGIFVHDTPTLVQVKNTVFRNLAGAGVFAMNGPNVVIANSQFLHTGGITAYSNTASTTIASVTDSIIANGAEGVYAATASNASAVVRAYVTRTTIHNVTYGLDAETDGFGTVNLFAGGNMVDASGLGWVVYNPGAYLITYGNNQFSGSGSYGSMTFSSLQ